MPQRKELIVSAIENGTVLDHLPADSVFTVVRILKLEELHEQITIGFNLNSKKYGKKGIIKVANKFFEPNQINKIALVAPTATIITIKNFEIIEKKNVEIPDEVIGLVKCINPKCITNNEKITTKFIVQNDLEEVKFSCYYCEKTMRKEDLEFL